jgi:hypothetical protein
MPAFYSSRGMLESARRASSLATFRCWKLALLKPNLCERTLEPLVRRWGMVTSQKKRSQNHDFFLTFLIG